MAKILVVEDDLELGEVIKDALSQHAVELVNTGDEALGRLKLYSYDLLVLDWGLPGKVSGIDVLKKYRSMGGESPVLMLTGRDTVVDKETGLDTGADDYLTKPFDVREFQARARALLRRQPSLTGDEIKAGDLVLNSKTLKASLSGREIDLLPKEFAILQFLMKHPNQFFTSEALLNRVWSSESDTSPDIMRVYITRIRKKIGESYIVTMRSAGYKFVSE